MFKSLSTLADNNKIIFVWVIFLFATLIVDSSIIRIYYFGLSQTNVSWKVILFIAIVIIFLASLNAMFHFVRKKSEEIRTRQVVMNRLHKMVMYSLVLLAVVVIFVVFQILTISRYNLVLLTVATMISYFTSMILMGVLAFQFFLWFKSNRSPVRFLYGIACSILVISGAFAVSSCYSYSNERSFFCRTTCCNWLSLFHLFHSRVSHLLDKLWVCYLIRINIYLLVGCQFAGFTSLFRKAWK